MAKADARMSQLRHITVWLLAAFVLNMIAQSGNAQVHVREHFRSVSDGNFWKNWSTKGNVNPYTGKPGTRVTPPADRGQDVHVRQDVNVQRDVRVHFYEHRFSPMKSNQFTPEGEPLVGRGSPGYEDRRIEQVLANRRKRLEWLEGIQQAKKAADIKRRVGTQMPYPARLEIPFRDTASTARPQKPWISRGENWAVSGDGKRGYVTQGANWSVGHFD